MFINNKTKLVYRCMLQSFWIIFILFAEKFEVKININIFRFKKIYLLYALSFVKIVLICNIYIIRKGAHLNFAMGATLHRYATGWCCHFA